MTKLRLKFEGNPSKNMIGAAGEYFVCAELCKKNILALLAPKNNPLYDIVATDPKGLRTVHIQVKTMGLENTQRWKLGKGITKKKNNDNLYIVLVNLRIRDSNKYYIFKYDELSDRVNYVYNEYINKKKKDGQPRKDVSFRWYDLAHFSKEDLNQESNWKILGF